MRANIKPAVIVNRNMAPRVFCCGRNDGNEKNLEEDQFQIRTININTRQSDENREIDSTSTGKVNRDTLVLGIR